MVDVVALISDAEAARNARSPFNADYDDIAMRMWPRQQGFATGQRPSTFKKLMRDSTAWQALDRAVAIMYVGITPRNSIWHTIGFQDDPELADWQPVKEYLEKILTTVIFNGRYAAGSGYDTAIVNMFKSEQAFGTGIFKLETEPGGLLYRYEFLPFRECYLTTDHIGRHNGIYRFYDMTPHQILSDFGHMPKSVKQAASSSPDQKFRVIEICRERKIFNPRHMGAKNMRFMSAWILEEDQALLRESGYHEFPYIVGRLMPDGTDPYGIGTGEMVQADVRELHQLVTTNTRGAMKQVDPVTFWQPDAVISGPISQNPGANNRGGVDSRGNAQFQQVSPKGSLSAGLEIQEQKRAAIRDGLWNRLTQYIEADREMTAYELSKRLLDNKSLISPALGQQADDVFNNQFAREYNIAKRRGLIPPPSARVAEVIGNKKIMPVYTGPLMQIFKSEEASGLQSYMQVVMPLIERGMDDFLINMDMPEVARTLQEGMGVTARHQLSRAEVKKIQAARAEKAAQDAQMEQLTAGAKALGSAGPGIEAVANMQGGADA